MKKFRLTAVLLVFFCISCKKIYDRKLAIDYQKFRSNFDQSLLNHFPKRIDFTENSIWCNTNLKKNDIGLFLTEYNVGIDEVKSVERKIVGIRPIAKYSAKKKCLLIVNRFETEQTRRTYSDVRIPDSASISNPCYKVLFPIPNFIDFSIHNKSNFWHDSGFDIYVLEAKAQKKFKNYDLQPDYQMPIDWKNGYSKGIAINREQKIVIYWLVIW